jgi:hypothetical protein
MSFVGSAAMKHAYVLWVISFVGEVSICSAEYVFTVKLTVVTILSSLLGRYQVDILFS